MVMQIGTGGTPPGFALPAAYSHDLGEVETLKMSLLQVFFDSRAQILLREVCQGDATGHYKVRTKGLYVLFPEARCVLLREGL